jgi:hypothetical protein
LALLSIDYKFLLIPLAFIVLRFWSFLGDIMHLYAGIRHMNANLSFTVVILGVSQSECACSAALRYRHSTRIATLYTTCGFLSTARCYKGVKNYLCIGVTPIQVSGSDEGQGLFGRIGEVLLFYGNKELH